MGKSFELDTVTRHLMFKKGESYCGDIRVSRLYRLSYFSMKSSHHER